MSNKNPLYDQPANPIDRDKINMGCTGLTKLEAFTLASLQGYTAASNNVPQEINAGAMGSLRVRIIAEAALKTAKLTLDALAKELEKI